MAHYAVAVITKTGSYDEIETLLTPFSEHITVEPYISETKEELIEYGWEIKEDIEKNIEKNNGDEIPNIYKNFLSAKTDEDIHKAIKFMYDGDFDENGNRYSTYNPDSKWDYWRIGGRWCDTLKGKDGNYYDSMKISDVDFSPRKEDEKYFAEFWEQIVEKRAGISEKYFTLNNAQYYIDKYGTKENFVEKSIQFITHAILTPDGNWLEAGKMGPWALSDATIDKEIDWEDNYIKTINGFNKNYYITIVDCHI